MRNAIYLIVGVFIVYQICKWLNNLRPSKKIENLEKMATHWMNCALRDSPIKEHNWWREKGRYVLEMTECDYLHLKERYRHDERKRLELAKDWLEYTRAVYELSYENEMHMVDANLDDSSLRRANALHTRRYEIEKSFQEMLGEKFVDRWNMGNEVTNE